MSNQLWTEFKNIEEERTQLKDVWNSLKKNKGDKAEIKRIGQMLTKLTFNQAHILINLEWEE